MTKKAADYTNDLQATFIEGMQKFAALNVENAEKITAMQMGIFQSYVDAAMGQFKAFSDVKDVKDVPEVFKKNAAELQAVSEKSVADMAELVRLNTAYGQEMQSLAQAMAAKVMPKAAA